MTIRRQQCGGGNQINDTVNSDGGIDFTIIIEIKQSLKKAKDMDQRLHMDGKSDVFKARVCVVFNRFIVGTEKICKITKDQLKSHEPVLGVESYTVFHGQIHPQLIEQYKLQGLEGLLFSPRAQCVGDSYDVYASCSNSLKSRKADSDTVPRHAIAN